jgi:hypothetical protein
MRYLKLMKAVSGHGYVCEYYDKDGVLIETKEIELGYLDKITKSRLKLRVTKQQWGLIVTDKFNKISSVYPINKPSKVS